MAGTIIPASHENQYRKEAIHILNVGSISLKWYWQVKNTSNVRGFANYQIELTHDLGFFSPDVSWLVYEPSRGLQYKGPQQNVFGQITHLEAQGFYALRHLVVIKPNGNHTIFPNSKEDVVGELTIPGGRASNAAKAFWEKMLRQFHGRLKFHLDVTLYAHDGTGLTASTWGAARNFHWNEQGATSLGEHRWQDIFEVDDES